MVGNFGTVAILMSTYNAEPFLKEQINSILGQTYTNWKLFIRDDGSSDSTSLIIEEFTKKDDRIFFVNKDSIKNVGVVSSFFLLLSCVKADFYMFCDQDDVWKADKVQITYDKMMQEDYQSIPICVFTDLEIVDADLNPERVMNGDNIWTEFLELLFTNCVTGCTVMVNQYLKQLIDFKHLNYDDIYMHDWWVGIIAAGLGKAIYINEPTIYYRQHGDNVVGSMELNTIGRLLHRATHLGPELKHVGQIVRIAHEFNKIYGNQMTGRDKKYLEAYAALYTDSGFWHNLGLVLRMPPQRLNPKGKLFYSYMFVIYNKLFKIA